ncbi:hypothetical protein MBLNU459_g5518t1 [Dothideomycetes sp. NU459]
MASSEHSPPDKTSDHEVAERAGSDATLTKSTSNTTLALVLATTALFALTAWFAASTFQGKPGNQANHILQTHLKLSFSSTVVILRVLQGLTSALTAAAVAQSFEGIEWALASRDRGVRLLSFLGISPTTGIIGAVKLLFGDQVRPSDRMWAVSRVISTVALLVAGVVLFAETSTVTAYNNTDTFHVTAGTGQFNGSFVEPFLKSIGDVVPYWALASTYNFVTNPLFAIPSRPISCPGGETQCDSYLLPGGTYLMSPQPSSQPSADSTIIIHDAPGTQIDFASNLDAGDQFLPRDCIVYGNDDSLVGVEFCLAVSQVHQGSIVAGVFTCPNGTQAGTCRISQTGSVSNVSTTMTVYSRQATTVCAASNNSILSAYDLGTPQLHSAINITALNLAVGWLLNYTASGLPAESSIAFWFWFGSTGTYASLWENNAYKTLQSLLAFLIWEFATDNNENPALASQQGSKQASLPAAFQTTASISQPFTRFALNEGAFITYIVIQSLALIFCWTVVIWLYISPTRCPEISSYPLLDFAGKLQEMSTNGTRTLPLPSFVLSESGDWAITRALAKSRVVIVCNDRDVAEPEAGAMIMTRHTDA